MHRDRAAAEGAGQLQVQDKGIQQGGRVLQPPDKGEVRDPGEPGEAPDGAGGAGGRAEEAEQQEMNRGRERGISGGDNAILSMTCTAAQL